MLYSLHNVMAINDVAGERVRYSSWIFRL